MSGKSRLVNYASDAIALVALRTAEPTHGIKQRPKSMAEFIFKSNPTAKYLELMLNLKINFVEQFKAARSISNIGLMPDIGKRK